TEIEAHVAVLAALRRRYSELGDPAFLGEGDVAWLNEHGTPMTVAHWEEPGRSTLQMRTGRLLIRFNRGHEAVVFTLPDGDWDGDALVPPRSVAFLTRSDPEEPAA
ncbi:MAG: glycogen debranching enzyme GlgX, partial [Sphingobium sp.]